MFGVQDPPPKLSSLIKMCAVWFVWMADVLLPFGGAIFENHLQSRKSWAKTHYQKLIQFHSNKHRLHFICFVQTKRVLPGGPEESALVQPSLPLGACHLLSEQGDLQSDTTSLRR